MKHLLMLLLLLLTACVNASQKSPTSNHQITQIAQSDVFIIYFEKDKKEHLIKAIDDYQDDIIYDDKNINGLTVKIKADDIHQKIQAYQKIDGVLQITKSKILRLH
ncbi:MAG: hypothetical protein Q3971_06985 [Moraxella sp.]|nr:hypothetical protein [Moraxella sp.]